MIEELEFAYFYGDIYGFAESHAFNSERIILTVKL